MTLSLADLRKAADRATAGPWRFGAVIMASGDVAIAQIIDDPKWPDGQVEANALHIALFNPQVALALLDAVSVLKSIHGRAGMTQLADCCVDKTCTPHYVDGEKEGGCTWQSGVARGFGECASLAEEALATLEAAGVKV